MLVDTKNVSLNDITNQWAREAIRRAGLPQGDMIKQALDDLPNMNFTGPLDVINYLNNKSKSYGQGEQFNITPLIELAKRIIKECGYRDDAQDISSPFITAYKYNSGTGEMDRVRIPVSQVLYFIKINNKTPRQAYVGGAAKVILNDHNCTELSLIDCSKNNTAEFLLDCYIKSAEEVVTAWAGK
jgi:hypothetical protein